MGIDYKKIKQGNTEALQSALIELIDLYNAPDFKEGYKAGMKDAAMALKNLIKDKTALAGFDDVVLVEDIEELIKTLEHE